MPQYYVIDTDVSQMYTKNITNKKTQPFTNFDDANNYLISLDRNYRNQGYTVLNTNYAYLQKPVISNIKPQQIKWVSGSNVSLMGIVYHIIDIWGVY